MTSESTLLDATVRPKSRKLRDDLYMGMAMRRGNKMSPVLVGLAGAIMVVATLGLLGAPNFASAASFMTAAFPTPAAATALVVVTIWLAIVGTTVVAALIALGDVLDDLQDMHRNRRHRLMRVASEVALGAVGFGLLALAVLHPEMGLHAGSAHQAVALLSR